MRAADSGRRAVGSGEGFEGGHRDRLRAGPRETGRRPHGARRPVQAPRRLRVSCRSGAMRLRGTRARGTRVRAPAITAARIAAPPSRMRTWRTARGRRHPAGHERISGKGHRTGLGRKGAVHAAIRHHAASRVRGARILAVRVDAVQRRANSPKARQNAAFRARGAVDVGCRARRCAAAGASRKP